MEPAALGIRLGSAAVAPLIRKLFVRDGPGAALVDRPVRVSRLVSFMGEKRTFNEKDMRRLSVELVQRAVRTAGPHDPLLPPEEEELVAEALMHSLHVLGELQMDDVQAVQLGPERLAWLLRKEARRPLFLSPDALLVHHTLLHTACLHILNFFTQRSTFVARTLVAQSRRLDELVSRVDLLIERTPALPAQDARFEWRYAQYIEQRHGLLTLYGVDLSDCREWPLDAAYVGLEATAPAPAAALGDAAQQPPPAVPVDRALAGHDRVLLRGVAGSGKSTLVQWLAVSCARQEHGTGLVHLLGRVPFVLPLRTLGRRGGLPAPRDFLAAVGSPLAGTAPDGWADRVLAAGRGLLLVDGIDEVPVREREAARRWLRELLALYPGTKCLVTARPPAVREDWLAREQFTELVMSRMRPGDMVTFIRRWHHAAGADPALDDTLLGTVRSRSDLGRLATNPLMCALICALHRDRRGFLPRGRKALYDAALTMLLERRDREREMGTPSGVDLDTESQTQLLQKLAYWLIRNGRAELDREDAVELLDRLLPSMPHVAAQGPAEQIYQHLLTRSGLLREPAPGTVDFVHRTFQDYLGAREAVEERDFDLIVHSAHLDQWEDVVRMAVAHARPGERAKLLDLLVRRGDAAEEQVRTRLHLLATACLEHATQLDPAVRERIEQRAAALIPPRSIDEAKQIAALGPVALELLPGPEGLAQQEALAVAHAAAQIGGDAALPLLTRYRDHPDVGVLNQLGGHWDRFDTDTYAEEIVRHLVGRHDVRLTVRSPAEAEALGRLGGHSCVGFSGDLTFEQIRPALDPGKLRDLTRRGDLAPFALSALAEYPLLEAVSLTGCAPGLDLAPLAGVPLTELWLWDVAGPTRPGSLEQLTGLHELGLRGTTHWPGTDRLPRAPALRTLLLPDSARDLSGLRAFPELSTLNLHGVTLPPTAEDWQAMADLPELADLCLDHHHLAAPEDVPRPLAAVSSLLLTFDRRRPEDAAPALAALPRLFPALDRLQLNALPPDVGLGNLAELPLLRNLVLVQPVSVPGPGDLPERAGLTVLPAPRRST